MRIMEIRQFSGRDCNSQTEMNAVTVRGEQEDSSPSKVTPWQSEMMAWRSTYRRQEERAEDNKRDVTTVWAR